MTNNYQISKSWTDEDSDMYQNGWRMNEMYSADDPGTRSFRLENNDKSCTIMESQPATHEEDGEITQSPTLTIIVQCHQEE